MTRFRSIVYAGLILSVFLLLSAIPAAAFCVRQPTLYNTGTLTGTGNTCTDAYASLESDLLGTANANCVATYGENSSFGDYSESLNACVQNGVGKLQTGSAQYRCFVCS